MEDAVVMYDKKTGRSRGFGFITYDSPDVVRKVPGINCSIPLSSVIIRQAGVETWYHLTLSMYLAIEPFLSIMCPCSMDAVT